MSWSGRRGVEPAVVAGIVIIVIGALFLLGNAGLLRVDWSLVWPLILIGLGVVVIAGAVGRPRGAGEATARVPRDGAGRLELRLRLGAGRYRLAGGAAELVEVSASEPTIESRVERRGDLVAVRLNPVVRGWPFNWGGGLDWRIAVAGDVPTMLDVEVGAGDFELDLGAVQVAGGRIAVGAAQLRVVLPRPRGEVAIRVEGGAASLAFDVPAGVEARVTASGLVSMSGPSETAGYASASDRVTVSVTGGAASVRVTGGR